MAGIGTKPSQLAPPGANQEEILQTAQMAEQSIARSPAGTQNASQAIAATQAPVPDMEADFAQFQANNMASMEDDFNNFVGSKAQAAPESPEEIESALRFKLSFAETDKERRSVLEQAFPGSSISQDGSDYVIKTASGKTFKTDDSGKLNLGDLADFGAEAVGMAAAGLAGAATIASVPATGGLGLPALAGIGAISGIADKGARDLLAARMGIKRDEDRSVVGEYGTAAALGGVFGGVGGAVEKQLAKKFAASEAASGIAKQASKVYQDEIAGKLANVKSLIDDGLLVPDADNPNVMLPAELTSAAPAQEAADLAKNAKIYQEYLASRDAGPLKGLWDNVVGVVANLGDNASDVGNRFSKVLETGTSKAGKGIEQFRSTVLKTGSKTQANLDNTLSVLDPNNADSIMSDLGFSFNFKNGTIEPGQIRNAAGEIGLKATPENIAAEIGAKAQERFAKDIAQDVIKLNKLIISKEGSIPVRQAEALRAEMAKKANAAFQANDSFSGTVYNKLRKSLDEDVLNGIESSLTPDQVPQFQADRARYGELKEASEVLKKALKADNVMAEKFATDIFGSKNLSADMLKQFKTVAKEDPSLFKDAFGTYVQSLVKGAANPREMASKLTKIPNEVIEIVTEGTGVTPKQWKQTIETLSSMSQTIAKAKSDEQVGLAASSLLALTDKIGAWGKVGLFKKLWSIVDKEGTALNYIRGQPIEAILKKVPPNKRGKAAELLNSLVQDVKVPTAIKEAGATLRQVPPIAARAAAKQTIREGAENLTENE